MKLLRLMALVAFLPFAALAGSPMETSQLVDGSGVPLGTFANPLFVSGGGGGGGGSSGPAYVGQFNSTLPTFASGQAGYLSVDNNGRLLISPSSSVLADLRIGGTAVSSSNPVPTSDGTDGAGTNPGTGARGWLSGIYARLGGTLSVVIGAGSNTIGAVTQAGTWAVNATLQAGSAIIGKVGIDQTTPGTTNGVVVNSSALPTGAATAANQSSEITQLTSISTRAVTFSEGTNSSVAASANLLGASRAAGSPATYSRFNAAVTTTQSGTLFIQGSNDSAFTVPVAMASVAVTAGQFANVSVPVIFPFNRAYLFNGTTAGTATLNTSYTAN